LHLWPIIPYHSSEHWLQWGLLVIAFPQVCQGHIVQILRSKCQHYADENFQSEALLEL